jgi:4-carboxymuconolactone decarboxylase
MKKLITSALIFIIAAPVTVNAQMPEDLPPDIDHESYSRLPIIYKDSFSEAEQVMFETINGPDTNMPRLGPPNSSMYSISPAEPYDVLNQRLRRTIVGRQFFEISTLVPAREFNQQYEWTAHELGAREAGVDQRVIDVIKYDRSTEGLPEREATVIEFGRTMLRGDHQVPSELFAKMVDLFGRQGTIEITMIMGDYTMTAMLLNAVDQHVPPARGEPLLPMP